MQALLATIVIVFMTHDEAKKELKGAGVTITAFAAAVGVSDVWAREQARRNAGQYTELYRLALLQFCRERAQKKPN